MNRNLAANIEYFHCCRRYLEGLLNRKDYCAAVRYYESMEKTLDGKSNAERAVFMQLGAAAYTGAGNPTRALGMIRTAMAILSETIGDKRELGDSYMILGDTLRELGEYNEAERAFRDAESIYRRNDYLSGSGDALNRQAGISFRRGDYNNSLKCLLESVEFARKENEKDKLAYLFGNIGRIYTVMGRFRKAEENIKFNIEFSRKLNDEVELARATLSLAYINIRRQSFNAAESLLKESLTFIEKNKLNKEKIIYLTYRGELALQAKKYNEAAEYLSKACEGGKTVAADSYLAARPIRWTAELMTARGNHRKALALANEALVVMKKLGNAVEIGALLKIKAICLEKLGQNDAARTSYQESIRILDLHRARVELADALSAAGKSEMFNDDRKTMYLCRAEDIYASLGASSTIEDIRKTIGGFEAKTMTDGNSQTGPEFRTQNPRMKKIVSQLKLLKDSGLPILLTGETGSGKDFLAKYFHSIARPQAPYVAVNCAAIPDNLIESELFGYHKGAFTGAEASRPGLFQSANNGVLLLDEIGELPPALQAKLLSILETRKLRPLGTVAEIELDILIIAATNRDLNKMVEAGTFRQDLYYRLAGITLELPSLRERKEDIPYLLTYFMHKFGILENNKKPDEELIHQFIGYHWPGNIRQLENKVNQLSAMASIAREGTLTELARGFFENDAEENTNSLFEQVEAFEKKILLEALVTSGGNKSRAARMLSIHESTFRAKMKRYHLEAAVN